MNTDEIERYVDSYNRLQSDINNERASGMPSKAVIEYAERAMARIEKRFKHAGLDINDYL